MGISSDTKRCPSTISETELLNVLNDLNTDDRVDGILVQLPLPAHINERLICDAVCVNKDVDGFNEKNVGRLCLDINSLIPCTALGVQELIRRAHIRRMSVYQFSCCCMPMGAFCAELLLTGSMSFVVVHVF